MNKITSRADPGVGHPFLAFLNTVTDDGKTRAANSFATAQDLTAELRAASVINAEAITATDLRALLVLRETAFAVFSALAAGRVPQANDTLTLTRALKSVTATADLQITPAGLITLPSATSRPYDQVVLAMEDLLRSDQFTRLRECRRCTHLFLDQGRGIGRRWCSMARCGNRAKAESFRARHRDAA